MCQKTLLIQCHRIVSAQLLYPGRSTFFLRPMSSFYNKSFKNDKGQFPQRQSNEYDFDASSFESRGNHHQKSNKLTKRNFVKFNRNQQKNYVSTQLMNEQFSQTDLNNFSTSANDSENKPYSAHSKYNPYEASPSCSTSCEPSFSRFNPSNGLDDAQSSNSNFKKYQNKRGAKRVRTDEDGDYRPRERPPPHLKGRQIGLWYKNNSKKNKEKHEKHQHIEDSLKMSSHHLERTFSLMSQISGESFDPSSYLPLPAGPKLDTLYQRHVKPNCGRYFDPQQSDAALLKAEYTENYDKILMDSLLEEKFNKIYKSRFEERRRLPAFGKRKEILAMIDQHQVLLISGETGCGKTTQVPQFILDDAIMSNKGSACNIVCTQPRRISAISIAERVAYERNELCGSECSVGYQIRLENKFPRSKGSILFCTSGILITKMQSDTLMEGISHLILDEVHERDLNSDFLLTIVRDLVNQRPDLKVILMSATLNASTFSEYFGECPTLHIPGFTFPVEETYLEDIMMQTKYAPPDQAVKTYNKLCRYASNSMQRYHKGNEEEMNNSNSKYENYADELHNYKKELVLKKYSPNIANSIIVMDSHLQNFIDPGLVVEVIKHIVVKDRRNGDGACGSILIFVPGWADISAVNKLIEKQHIFFDPAKFLVIPLHSMMPTVNQKKVFDRPPEGVRKIVIATNIAETSITIDDIVYVIDCGKIKLTTFQSGSNITTLEAQWGAKANAKQRRGRAGRVQAGHCFYLFTKLQESKMVDFIPAEILRTPLEELCLKIKYLNLGDIREFCDKLIESPSKESITLSCQKLKDLCAFDPDENLTSLGYHLAQLPIHPQLGKMLILSTLFSCTSPILTITSMLSFKEPFKMILGMERELDHRKKTLAKGFPSDHLMMVNVFNQWKYLERNSIDERSFCFENFLSLPILSMVDKMRVQFADYLHKSGFLSSSNINNPEANVNSNKDGVILAVLAGGLYPNIAKLKHRRKRQPRNKPLRFPPSLMDKRDHNIKFHPKVVCFPDQLLNYDWICYYEKMKTAALYLHDASVVNPLALLLFGRNLKTVSEPSETLEKHSTLVEIDGWIKLAGKTDQLSALLHLRLELDKMIQKKVKDPGTHLSANEKALRSLLVNLLCT